MVLEQNEEEVPCAVLEYYEAGITSDHMTLFQMEEE